MPLTRIKSLGITDGTIVNADINASAAIDSTKLSGVSTDYVRISTNTVSSAVSSVDLNNVFSSTYNNYKIIGYLASSYAGFVYLRGRIGTGSTPTYITSGSYFWNNNGALTLSDNSESTISNGTYNDSAIDLGGADLRSSTCAFEINIHNANSASNNTQIIFWNYAHMDAYENRIEGNNGRGVVLTANALTSFRLYFSAGNIDSGKAIVYGLKDA